MSREVVGMANSTSPNALLLVARSVRTMFLFLGGPGEIDAFAQELGRRRRSPIPAEMHAIESDRPRHSQAPGRSIRYALMAEVRCSMGRPLDFANGGAALRESAGFRNPFPSLRSPLRPSVAVLDQVTLVAEQQRKTLQPLTDDLPLIGSGLDSLCIAIIVANLEDEVGIDPFGVGGGVEMPTTLGEFITLYENAAA